LLDFHFPFFLHIKQQTMEFTILSPVAAPTVNFKQRMEVDGEEVHLVNPGETVTTDQQFMR
jgi:exosome complex component RRP4